MGRHAAGEKSRVYNSRLKFPNAAPDATSSTARPQRAFAKLFRDIVVGSRDFPLLVQLCYVNSTLGNLHADCAFVRDYFFLVLDCILQLRFFYETNLSTRV